jgi:Ca2+-binding RTX toxin-like protein
MAVYDLLQLDLTLTANSIPQAVRGQIEDYLYNHGFFNSGSNPLHDPPFANVTNTETPTSDVEWLHGSNITVTTDANLNYVLDGTVGNTITINDDGGAHDIGVSILGGTTLFLNDQGDDSISANGGSNTIKAGGSSGDITVRGSSSGSDTIFGGTGHDVLIAAQGGGTLRSGSLTGGWNVLIDENATGATSMVGGGGADTIYAQGGDTLVAGSGDDQLLWALGGSNTLRGGSGDDQTLRASGSGVAGPGFDVMHGGSGNNFLWADTTAGSGRMFSGQLGGDHVLDNESTNSWTMVAGAGNDTIYSGDGSDVLKTGTGSVSQLLYAGAGDDKLVSRTTGGTSTLYAGTGNDTLDASQSSGSNVFYIGYGNETVKGGSGFDYFNDTTTTGAAGSSTNVIQITGQSGDILHFTDRTLAQVTGDNISGGIRTIDFSDGQQYKVSAVVAVEFHN